MIKLTDVETGIQKERVLLNAFVTKRPWSFAGVVALVAALIGHLI